MTACDMVANPPKLQTRAAKSGDCWMPPKCQPHNIAESGSGKCDRIFLQQQGVVNESASPIQSELPSLVTDPGPAYQPTYVGRHRCHLSQAFMLLDQMGSWVPGSQGNPREAAFYSSQARINVAVLLYCGLEIESHLCELDQTDCTKLVVSHSQSPD